LGALGDKLLLLLLAMGLVVLWCCDGVIDPILVVVVGFRGECECECGSGSLLGIRGAVDVADADADADAVFDGVVSVTFTGVAFCAGSCTSADGSFNVDSVVPIVSY